MNVVSLHVMADSDKQPTVVTCAVTMHFSPGELERAVQVLRSVVGHVQTKAGCRACTVARDVAEDGWVHYFEEWESATPFHQHVRSEEFRSVLVAMDMCCEEPRAVVGTLSGHRGLEYLSKLRTEKPKP